MTLKYETGIAIVVYRSLSAYHVTPTGAQANNIMHPSTVGNHIVIPLERNLHKNYTK